jgi:hypothetical protein
MASKPYGFQMACEVTFARTTDCALLSNQNKLTLRAFNAQIGCKPVKFVDRVAQSSGVANWHGIEESAVNKDDRRKLLSQRMVDCEWMRAPRPVLEALCMACNLQLGGKICHGESAPCGAGTGVFPKALQRRPGVGSLADACGQVAACQHLAHRMPWNTEGCIIFFAPAKMRLGEPASSQRLVGTSGTAGRC